MKKETGIDQLFHEAHSRVLKVSRNFHLLHVLRAFLWLCAYGIGLLVLFAVVQMLFELSVPVRSAFWAGSAVLTLYYLVWHILPGLRRAFQPDEKVLYGISKKIGQGHEDVQDALVNFLQIYNEQGSHAPPAFRNLSLKQLYERFRSTNFANILSFGIIKDSANRLLIACLVFALLFLVFPASISQAVLKVIYPTRSFEKPLPLTLYNQSGEMKILKNESVQLQGSYEGITPHKLWLVVRFSGEGRDSATTEKLPLTGKMGKIFSYEVKHVKESFEYWFEGRVEMSEFRNRLATSEKATVDVKDRPFVRELQLKLTYPAYTRLPETLLPPNNGEVTALNGTLIDLNIQANKSLEKAWCVFQDSTEMALQVFENKAQGQFAVKNDTQYHIRILDADGISNYQPVQYAIFALADEMPYVEIARPGQDLDLGEELEIPMLINLRDDFGFRNLSLKGRHVHAGGKGDTSGFELKVPYQKLDQNRGIADYRWDLSSFFMIPEDYIEYYAEVSDNDAISGPKVGRSKTFILRLPSLIEILENADEKVAEQLDETEDIAKETEELRKKLEEINREMKREEELSWERKQEIQEQLDKQKQSMEKLKEVREELENMVSDLEKQDMMSPETLEKYFELQKMFQDLASEEMMEAMKKLQDAMEESNMDEVKKAMEQFKLSMEEFEQKIERTFELFKRIELEQKMDELAKMAEKLEEEQEAINKQLENEDLNNEQKEQLADKEKSLEKNTDHLEEQLKKAIEDFKEMMAETAQDLQETQEMMESQQLQEQMQEMQQQMQQGEMQQAQKSGENLEKQLEMLQSMMQQAKQNMNQAQKQEVMQAMQKVQQDLLRASFQQERLMKQTSNVDVASSQITDVARQQSQMRENANNIIEQMLEISKQTFFMSPQMNKQMAGLQEEMEKAIESLENRNTRNAARSQKSAMASLNQAIMSMQSAMNQLSAASSASGFQEMMEQLQQMAGQQGQLNQESMGMFQQQGQGRPQPSAEALGRMAAQQEMIRQSLEKMNQQQGGNQKDMLGRLGELGEEMEKVIDDLQRQQLDRKVIERQQRILSRMLDAQKSVREREHSKKRQAERDNNVVAKSPPALKKEMLEREDKLRKEMLEALKEGYSPEYKEYIKAYYEILSRQNVQNGGGE